MNLAVELPTGEGSVILGRFIRMAGGEHNRVLQRNIVTVRNSSGILRAGNLSGHECRTKVYFHLQDTNIFGQTAKALKNLSKFRLLSISTTSWLGSKAKSTTNNCSRANWVFKSLKGIPFPKNFMQVIKVIFKRLFRVYAHIYHSHFQHIMSLGLEYHLNTCFKHFIYFVDEFRLVDEKELAPLAELIQQFKLRKENI
jgi:hypothetical protein